MAPNASALGKKAFEIFRSCFEQGVWIRPAGDNLVVCPPYIVTDAHIEQIVSTMAQAIRQHA